MDISIEQYHKICLFLDAEMTLPEMEAFEQELLGNEAMRNQLDFEQAVRDGFDIGATKEQGNMQPPIKGQENKIQSTIFKATNGQPVENTSGSGKGTPRHLWRGAGLRWLVAASVLLAVVALFIGTKKTVAPTVVPSTSVTIKKQKDTAVIAAFPLKKDSINTPNLAVLYKQYFTKDKLPDTYPMLLADAFSNYENGDYNAIEQLNLADISDTRGGDALNSKQSILELGHYYKAIALMATNKAQQAIINFNWVIKNSTDIVLKQKATWYLALAFIKLDDKEKAIAELKKLPGNFKAKELLKALK